ncbi:xylose reductase [Phycomyces nitens]|nr:xylose reductase [Phycomyces nitens]
MTLGCLKLNPTGDKMPLIGFGCMGIPRETTKDKVYRAIQSGYRMIDSAPIYGNEVEVGQGIKEAIKDRLVDRKDLFVVTKLWNTFHHKKNVGPALEKSLEDLQLTYADLYLIHCKFPVPLKAVDINSNHHPLSWYQPGSVKIELERSPMKECWEAMEELVDTKAARNIGISNFNVQSILDLLTYAHYKPSVLQVELHPYLQQTRLVKWAQANKVRVTAYSPFGPLSYVKNSEKARSTLSLLDHPVINSIALKYNRTAAQVLLSWSISRKVAVIPRSSNIQRLKSNLEASLLHLHITDVEQINSLEAGIRFNDEEELPIFC